MFTLELVTLNGVKFSKEVYQAVIPTVEGYIGVFPNHAPLVGLIAPGVISMKHNQNEPDDMMEHFAINGGIVDIDEKRIRVLVDEADHSSELTATEVQEALDRAKELAKQSTDQVSLDKANQEVQMAQARLRVAEIKRRRKA